jgi:hypothetical protein
MNVAPMQSTIGMAAEFNNLIKLPKSKKCLGEHENTERKSTATGAHLRQCEESFAHQLLAQKHSPAPLRPKE